MFVICIAVFSSKCSTMNPHLILQNKVDININEGILSFYLHNKTLCLDFLKISYFLFVVIWNIIVILGMWLSFITIKNELLIKND